MLTKMKQTHISKQNTKCQSYSSPADGPGIRVRTEAAGFGLELVSTKQALGKIGLETPEVEVQQPKRKKSTGLPMPSMPGDEEVNS
jgi:hypothetical protein